MRSKCREIKSALHTYNKRMFIRCNQAARIAAHNAFNVKNRRFSWWYIWFMLHLYDPRLGNIASNGPCEGIRSVIFWQDWVSLAKHVRNELINTANKYCYAITLDEIPIISIIHHHTHSKVSCQTSCFPSHIFSDAITHTHTHHTLPYYAT